MKTWTCKNKQKARLKSIIEPYRKVFDTRSLPSNKLYCCTSGLSANKNGIIPNCELDQMLKSGQKIVESYGYSDLFKIYSKNTREV